MADFNHFAQIAGEMQIALVDIVVKSANDLAGLAASNAPVRTGFLQNSITVEDGADAYSRTVVVGADYGVYVELGTRHMAPQPYFYPAVEATRDPFVMAVAAIESRL